MVVRKMVGQEATDDVRSGYNTGLPFGRKLRDLKEIWTIYCLKRTGQINKGEDTLIWWIAKKNINAYLVLETRYSMTIITVKAQSNLPLQLFPTTPSLLHKICSNQTL